MVNKCFGNGSVEKIIQNNLNKRCCQSQPLKRLCIGYVLTIKRKRKKKSSTPDDFWNDVCEEF